MKIRPASNLDIASIDSLFKSENYEILRIKSNQELQKQRFDTNNLCMLYLYVGQSYLNENIDSSAYFFQKAAFYAECTHLQDYIIKANVYLLFVYNRCIDDSTNRSAQLFAKLDLMKDGNIGLKNKMLLFTGLSDYYKLKGKEYLYLSTLFKTAKYGEQFAATGEASNSDSNNLGITYQNIGRYYIETNQTHKAFEYYKLSRLWIRDYKRGLANYYRGMMALFLMKNELKNALPCVDSMHALLNGNDGGVVDVTMRAEIELAYYYLSKTNIDAARDCYRFSDGLIYKNANEVIKGRLTLLEASLLIKEKKYKSALPYLASIESEVRRWALEEYVPFFITAAECNAGLRRYKKANEYYQTYLQLSDSLNNKNLKQSLAFAEAEYQNETKQLEINNQKFIIALAQKQRLWLIAALTSLVFFSALIFIFYSSKRKYAQILNLRNVELLKLNVQLDEANKTKATLFGILSHDLRAPISDVYQLLKIRHLELLGNEEKEILEEEIRSGTASLLEIMEDLLIWSKTQLEAIHTEIEDVEIGKVFKQCQDIMQLNIQSKELRLVNRIGQKSIVRTDLNFLQIIVRNLLQNAIKASPYKGSIEAGFCITRDCRSCFWLMNSGPQFSQDHYLEALQKKNTSQTLHQGLGLKLIEELSRRINIEVRFDVVNGTQTCCTLFFN